MAKVTPTPTLAPAMAPSPAPFHIVIPTPRFKVDVYVCAFRIALRSTIAATAAVAPPRPPRAPLRPPRLPCIADALGCSRIGSGRCWPMLRRASLRRVLCRRHHHHLLMLLLLVVMPHDRASPAIIVVVVVIAVIIPLPPLVRLSMMTAQPPKPAEADEHSNGRPASSRTM